MRQYQQFKAQYPDYVLFFRMGDFYEMFWDDAELASRVLGVALTSRNNTPTTATRLIAMIGIVIAAGPSVSIGWSSAAGSPGRRHSCQTMHAAIRP